MSRREISQLFPSTVYRAPLEKGSQSLAFRKLLIRECGFLREQDRAGQIWSQENYPNGYTSYGSVDRLHQFSPSFAELEKKIRPHLRRYLKALSFSLRLEDLELDTLWINMMSKGAQHSLHLHPRSVFSGTYYLSLPKGSSPLRFEDPRIPQFMNRPSLRPQAPAELQNYFTLEPQVGDLVLFESWLKHQVLESRIVSERISVSFNFNWK